MPASIPMRLWLLSVLSAVVIGGINSRAQSSGLSGKASNAPMHRPLEGRCFRIETSNGSVVSGRVARATSHALIIEDKVHFPEEFAPEVRRWIFEGAAGPNETFPKGVREDVGSPDSVPRAPAETGSAKHQSERSCCIHHAASAGSTDDVSWFLSQGIPINATNEVGVTALQVAAQCNQIAVMKYLVSVGAKLDVEDNNRHSLMHFAAAGDAVDSLNYLSKQGLSFRQQDCFGYTPLHSAAAEGNLAAAEWLLQTGADAKAPGLLNVTPLRVAVMFGHARMVRLLVSHGADPNEELCVTKETALSLALSLGHLDVCKALLEAGAAPKPPAGKSLLHAAACRGTEETMDLLMAFGLSVDEENGLIG
ncbi:MAG: ankyrin repeat domain-containing protein [Kiritimatiellia bacterium]